MEAPSQPDKTPETPQPANPEPEAVTPEAIPEAAPEVAEEKFTLPTSSRPVHLEAPEPGAPQAQAQVLAGGSAPTAEAGDEEAAARVREREAKARLLAIRRIEWVGIALVTLLLGSAVWSWRSRSDALESRRESFNASPVPLPRGGPSLAWRKARPDEVKAASQAIKGQLDAFKRDDFAKAATWQSEELRLKFGSVDAFRRAIKEAYPAFAAYKGVRFGPALALRDGKMLRIVATLRGPKDEDVPADYILVREDGAYRIASVTTSAVVPPKDAPGSQDAAPAPGAEII